VASAGSRKGSIYFNRQRIKLRRAILRKPTFHISTSSDTSLGGLDVNIALLETTIGPMQLRKNGSDPLVTSGKALMILCTPKPNIWSLEALHIIYCLMFSNVELVLRLQWQGFGEVFLFVLFILYSL